MYQQDNESSRLKQRGTADSILTPEVTHMKQPVKISDMMLSILNPDTGIGFLLNAAASFLISITCYYYFLANDYFVLPKKAWTTEAGYTKLDFVYFVLGTYFLPVGILLLLIFVSKSSKHRYSRPASKFFMYLFLTAVFSVGAAVSGNNAKDVLGCIGHFCTGKDGSALALPGVVSANLVLYFISLFFVIIFLGVTVMEGISLYQKNSRRIFSSSALYSSTSATDNSALHYSAFTESPQNDKEIAEDILITKAAEKRHRNVYRKAWISEAIFIALLFLVLYPILILACTLLPTWWNNFSRLKIQQYQMSVPSQAYGTYWALQLNNNILLKLYPDIAIYYGAIYFVSILALIAQFWSPLRLFFLKRLTPTVCVGQALLGFGLFSLLVGEWCYWFFSHAWENNLVKPRSNAELAARSFGQIGNVVIGLLVLPVAKNGVWSRIFGVSWEGMIIYHKILGYTFLLIILAHMFSWWAVYEIKGSFPSDIFAVPMTYHKDNFTIPLSVLTSIFMFVIMGGLTFHLIRRKNYELFYYFHLFSGIIFLSVLW